MKILLTIIIIIGAVFLLDAGVSKYERVECLGWARQKTEHLGFYATDWQKAQCLTYKIELE